MMAISYYFQKHQHFSGNAPEVLRSVDEEVDYIVGTGVKRSETARALFQHELPTTGQASERTDAQINDSGLFVHYHKEPEAGSLPRDHEISETTLTGEAEKIIRKTL